MRYRRTSVSMWGDAKFRGLSMTAKHVWDFIRTGPCTLNIPGVCTAREGTVADWTGLEPAQARSALQELQAADMIRIDPDVPLIWMPRAIVYNPPENANVITGWAKSWDLVPESPLRGAILETLSRHVAELGDRKKSDAFEQAFGVAPSAAPAQPEQGELFDTGSSHAEGSPEKMKRPVGGSTVSGSVPEPFATQDQEQEQEQEETTTRARARLVEVEPPAETLERQVLDEWRRVAVPRGLPPVETRNGLPSREANALTAFCVAQGVDAGTDEAVELVSRVIFRAAESPLCRGEAGRKPHAWPLERVFMKGAEILAGRYDTRSTGPPASGREQQIRALADLALRKEAEASDGGGGLQADRDDRRLLSASGAG